MRADVVRDVVTERFQSQVRRVAGFTPLKGIDGGLANMPRCGEIRLTHTEGDHVIPPEYNGNSTIPPDWAIG